MAKDFDTLEDSNRSGNPSIHDVSDPRRRVVLQGGLAAAIAGAFGPLLASCAGMVGRSGPLVGFKGIPVGTGDALVVPDGYVAEAFAPWGEPIGAAGAAIS